MLREALSGRDPRTASEMAALFVLDRINHNVGEGGIEQMLAEGIDVICDRYYYSTLAYHGSVIDYSWVRALNIDCPDIRRPDLCLFLDLTPEQSMARISAGRESTEIFENVETLTRVRNSFMRVIEDLGRTESIKVIDASSDIETVAASILAAVAAEEE